MERLRFPAEGDEALHAKAGEVLGERRLAQRDPLDEGTDGQLPFGDEVAEDEKANARSRAP